MVVIFVWVTFNYKNAVRFKVNLNKLNCNYETFGQSDLRTIGPSDNRTFGLLGLRTIGPSDYWADTDIMHMYREQLRVDGRLTGCETGDRIIISKTLTSPMLKAVNIGRFNAYISHQGQPQQTSNRSEVVYHKCLEPGHFIFNCENECKCRRCKQAGHKQIYCSHAMGGTIFDEEMPQGDEFNSHDARDDREQVQSEEQNETIEVEKEERQTEHQNEECSTKIEQHSNKNSVNDSGRKPKGQSNNGKSESIKVSANEASKRKEQNNLGQSNIKGFTTPASKLKPTSQHTPLTPPSREDQRKKKYNG